MDNRILAELARPKELEALYHEDKERFKKWLVEALATSPDSETLAVWDARINRPHVRSGRLGGTDILVVVLLSLLALAALKLPVYGPFPEADFSIWFYPRFTANIVIASLVFWFLFSLPHSGAQKIGIVSVLVAALLFSGLLPDRSDSDSILMSQIFLPLFLVTVAAVAFMGENWRQSEARLAFIRCLGESFIYAVLILLGGVVLTMMTLSLFHLIGYEIEDWYANWVVVCGLAAAPIVAVALYDRVLQRQSGIATLIANTFSPLFLVTIVCYLVAMFFARKNPYLDRDFLITFNGLLLLVWGMTVFSTAGRRREQRAGLVFMINTALIVTTLIIDTIALSAILFRLFEYGISPNKVVVVGSNMLIFCHLVLILKAYVKEVRSGEELLADATARFLPVYTGWSLFVAIVLPFLFAFK